MVQKYKYYSYFCVLKREFMQKTSVELIDTGYFYADGGAMFGVIPLTSWRRRYPCDEQKRCVLAMRIGLVVTECGRIILIDNGIGNKQLKRLKSTTYGFFDLVDICEALKVRGIMPEQVTDIVLTHLHFDHCGGTTCTKNGSVVPVFPKATCWVSRSQWESSLQPNPLEADSFFPENMESIEKSGKLQLIDSDTDLCESVQLRIYEGHTEGQIVPYIQTDTDTYVFAGDVIPIAAHISPLWISAYDIRPLTSYHEKIRLLDEAAARNQLIVHYHDAYTSCSTVKKVSGHFSASKIHV
jgi:glyoxylase-like metal-dependent hydrolase (beta-lactamase superfamily II)